MGYGLAALSAGLSQAIFLALLGGRPSLIRVGFCLGRGCWIGVTMIASSLNHAGCVITTSGVFSFLFFFLHLAC